MPKWFQDELENDTEESVKTKANRQEKNFAKRTKHIGGRRQIMSGALWSAKGDNIIGNVALGDNKFTKHNSFRITKEMWKKITQEALEQVKDIPFLQIEMGETEALVVLSENDFIMLLENYMKIE